MRTWELLGVLDPHKSRGGTFRSSSQLALTSFCFSLYNRRWLLRLLSPFLKPLSPEPSTTAAPLIPLIAYPCGHSLFPPSPASNPPPQLLHALLASAQLGGGCAGDWRCRLLRWRPWRRRKLPWSRNRWTPSGFWPSIRWRRRTRVTRVCQWVVLQWAMFYTMSSWSLTPRTPTGSIVIALFSLPDMDACFSMLCFTLLATTVSGFVHFLNFLWELALYVFGSLCGFAKVRIKNGSLFFCLWGKFAFCFWIRLWKAFSNKMLQKICWALYQSEVKLIILLGFYSRILYILLFSIYIFFWKHR